MVIWARASYSTSGWVHGMAGNRSSRPAAPRRGSPYSDGSTRSRHVRPERSLAPVRTGADDSGPFSTSSRPILDRLSTQRVFYLRLLGGASIEADGVALRG